MKRKLTISHLFHLAVLLVSLTASAETLVFVSESGENRIAIYSLNQDSGTLTRKGEMDTSGAVGALAISADKKYLYASVRGLKSFSTFSIDDKAQLLKLVSTVPASGSSAYIYPDRSGKWLLSACYGDGIVSVSTIKDGVITGEPIQVLEVGKRAHCIQTSPSNRFAFCPHTSEMNGVDQFRFDPKNGKLSFNEPKKLTGEENQGPRHLQFHPNGKWVYLVNEQSKSVSQCSFDEKTGLLQQGNTWSTLPKGHDQKGGSCADIEISSDGNFLYASNRGHDSIAVFQIDPDTGELTTLGQTPTEETPRSFNLIPGGEKYLVAAGQKSGKLVVYRRDPTTGKLSELKRYACGKSPAWVQGVYFE